MNDTLAAARTAVHRPKGPVIVTVCTSCRAVGTNREDAPGLALFEALRAMDAGEGVLIRPTQCLSVCKRVCTVSISAEGSYAYLFGDLVPDTAPGAVIAMAAAVAAADFGFVTWKDRPEALRNGILARIPPPGWSPEDGSAPA